MTILIQFSTVRKVIISYISYIIELYSPIIQANKITCSNKLQWLLSISPAFSGISADKIL